MINILIVDDQKIFREDIKIILSSCNEINVIGEVENGRELLYLLQNLSPDVVVTDIKLPMINGIEATKIIKEQHKDVKVIILTDFFDDEYIFDSIKYGVDGYISKKLGIKHIVNIIKSVYNGSMFLDPKAAAKVVQAYNSMNNENSQNKIGCDALINKLDILTPREIDIASLISKGKSNKDICKTLFLSEGTVKNYVTRILSKLELHSRTELALFMNDSNINIL